MFTGAIVIWANAFSAALLRGGGDTATPAASGLLASIAYVPLSGILTLGIADWPGWGVAARYRVAWRVRRNPFFQVRAIGRGRLGFVPRWDGLRLQWRIFREIFASGYWVR